MTRARCRDGAGGMTSEVIDANRLAGPVDAHHDQARFTWELGPDGAEAPIVGFDVVQTDGDGRLHTVLGFLDKVPATA